MPTLRALKISKKNCSLFPQLRGRDALQRILRLFRILQKTPTWGFASRFMAILKINSISYFDSLIVSLFVYGLEVWGSACNKYLDRIDNFCKRAYRYGNTAKTDFKISTLIEERDKLLFKKIITTKDHPLQDLLPERSHEFQLPQIRTERYKNSFINRCLFKFV